MLVRSFAMTLPLSEDYPPRHRCRRSRRRPAGSRAGVPSAPSFHQLMPIWSGRPDASRSPPSQNWTVRRAVPLAGNVHAHAERVLERPAAEPDVWPAVRSVAPVEVHQDRAVGEGDARDGRCLGPALEVGRIVPDIGVSEVEQLNRERIDSGKRDVVIALDGSLACSAPEVVAITQVGVDRGRRRAAALFRLRTGRSRWCRTKKLFDTSNRYTTWPAGPDLWTLLTVRSEHHRRCAVDRGHRHGRAQRHLGADGESPHRANTGRSGSHWTRAAPEVVLGGRARQRVDSERRLCGSRGRRRPWNRPSSQTWNRWPPRTCR